MSIQLKPVEGWNGKYAAGDDGNIYCFSKAGVNAKRPYPFALSAFVGSSGYLFVSLIGEKNASKNLHVLICEAFHGPRPERWMCVRHLDGNKSNNTPSNLAWGTYSQNEADKKRHGRAACGSRHGAAKLTEEGVRIIRASIPFGLWDSRNAAQVFGISVSRINRIAKGSGWDSANES